MLLDAFTKLDFCITGDTGVGVREQSTLIAVLSRFFLMTNIVAIANKM